MGVFKKQKSMFSTNTLPPHCPHPLVRENPQLRQLAYLRYIHLVQDIYLLFKLQLYKSKLHKKFQVKTFWQKVFLSLMDVNFHNMAIRNCDYPAVIKPQKLSLISLLILLVFLEKQLKQEIFGSTNHLVGRSIASFVPLKLRFSSTVPFPLPVSFVLFFWNSPMVWCA